MSNPTDAAEPTTAARIDHLERRLQALTDELRQKDLRESEAAARYTLKSKESDARYTLKSEESDTWFDMTAQFTSVAQQLKDKHQRQLVEAARSLQIIFAELRDLPVAKSASKATSNGSCSAPGSGSPPRGRAPRDVPFSEPATSSDAATTTTAQVKEGGSAIQKAVKAQAFHVVLKDWNETRDNPVNTAAHLVKKSYLRNLSMYDASKDFPASLVATAKFFGPYDREFRTKVRAGEFSEDINTRSLAQDGRKPMLQWSSRNVLMMPKGLEVCMDDGQWAFEPLLPADVSATDPDGWLPTMWRVKVLASGDARVSVTRCADSAAHHISGEGPCFGFTKGLSHVFSAPLSECANCPLRFEWKEVGMRALVFTYLYTLANQRFPGTTIPDPGPLAEGIARIREWLEAVRALGSAVLNADGTDAADPLDKLRYEAVEAPSLELVEGWLDSLQGPSSPLATVVRSVE